MSRSNPTDNSPNPCVRWFDWDGENGNISYYDKVDKQDVTVPDGFRFILLDQTATVGGFHKSSKSGIFCNEVKDTRSDVLLVKARKGGVIAHGLYAAIKEKVAFEGGRFVSRCYIGFFQADKKLVLGNISFKGGALRAWMEFCKEHRAEVYKQAIQVKGYTEGTIGKVTFRNPVFHVVPLSEATEKEAVKLDADVLQPYLKAYFARTTSTQAQPPSDAQPDANYERGDQEPPPTHEPAEPIEDDVPF